MKEKHTYIYSLEFPEGNIRYIGKADNLKKRYQGHLSKINQNTSHKNSWIKSLIEAGEKPVMNVVDKVPSKEWEFWEEHYIWLFRSFGFKLTNLTFGGDGASNLTHEVKSKISETLKRTYSEGYEAWNKGTVGLVGKWNKGIVRTEEQKRKISKTKKEMYASGEVVVWNKGVKTGQIPWNRGKVGVMPVPWNKGTEGIMKAWNKGVPMSEEGKKKCSTNSTRSRKAMQFTLNGEFIKEWVSAAEAHRGLSFKGVNYNCNGKARSAGGFIWLWSDEYSEELLKERVLAYKNKNKNKSRGKGGSHSCSKKVAQLDPDTKEVIEVFNSMTEAKKETGRGNIRRSCLEGTKANGFLWKYLDDK